MRFFCRQLKILAIFMVLGMMPPLLSAETIESILEDAGVLHSFSCSLPPDNYGWYYNQFWDSHSLGSDDELAFYYSLFYFDPWPYEKGMVIRKAGSSLVQEPPFVLQGQIVEDMEIYESPHYKSPLVSRRPSSWHSSNFWNSCFDVSPVMHYNKTYFPANFTSPPKRQYHFTSTLYETPLQESPVPGVANTSGSWADKRTTENTVRYPKGYNLRNPKGNRLKDSSSEVSITNRTYPVKRNTPKKTVSKTAPTEQRSNVFNRIFKRKKPSTKREDSKSKKPYSSSAHSSSKYTESGYYNPGRKVPSDGRTSGSDSGISGSDSGISGSDGGTSGSYGRNTGRISRYQ